MKKIMKLAGITALMAIGIAAANAQTTNVVLQLNVALSGFKQVDEANAAPARVNTKSLIDALNAITVDGIPAFTFGKTARVLVVSQAGGDGGTPSFIVREKVGTANVDTDVNAYVSVSPSDAGEVRGINKTAYTILTFHFDDGAGTDFTVSGFTTLRNGKAAGKGVGAVTDVTTGVVANVSGTGHVAGDFAVLKGTITGAGAKAEVVD
jgi:hypothetical protein